MQSNSPRRPVSGGRDSFSAHTRTTRSRPSSASSARAPYGGQRSAGGRGRFPARGRSRDQSYDESRFVNKAVITETVDVFTPEHRFIDFAISEELKTAITKRKYEFPTPIQDKVIPHILRGDDVVGLANTGTGKTAAFLIPLINRVLADSHYQTLILAPTRELALQIESELQAFTRGMRVYSAACVGGASIGSQIAKLRHHTHFVIGTPGRVLDLMNRGALVLRTANAVVLDEADRMLDMGFITDIRRILSATPEARNTLFFSATMSADIKRLITDFLKNPVTISVKTQDTSKNVDQDVVKIRGMNKFEVLCDLLSDKEFSRVLVFGRTKHGVEKLSVALAGKGIAADSIHGNKTQGQRERALRRFKEGATKVLVATDVAARGLDIDNISHVINFDLPGTYDDYVHRIGRTGRGSKKGKALTFVE